MNAIETQKTIPALTKELRDKFEKVVSNLEKLPQAKITTTHNLHAGVYSRTVFIPKGVMIVGCEMQKATMLVQYGHGAFTDGHKVRELKGYQVLEGSAYRQCAWISYEDTWATMYFATNAKTVEEAEKEFCSDPDRLITNKEKKLCQE